MRGEKGQVTIFIILALVIIVIGVLIYAFLPGLKSTTSLDTKNPAAYIESCIEDDVEEIVQTLSLQGGEINPEGTIKYMGHNIKYLCYSEEDMKFCNVQQPLLESSIEKEIKTAINPIINSCFDTLKEDFDKKGYNVNLKKEDFSVEILPGRILFDLDYELTLSKGSTEIYESFNIFLNNNLYQLISIAESIVEKEAAFGDADTLAYMMMYKNMKVEKLKQTDETKIYILTNKDTGEVFQFASRSLAFPQGVA